MKHRSSINSAEMQHGHGCPWNSSEASFCQKTCRQEIDTNVNFLPCRYDATVRKLGKHIDGILQPKMQAKIQHIDSFLRNSFGLSPDELKDVANGRRKLDITSLEVTMLEGAQDDIRFITQPDNTISALSLLKLLHWIIVELTMPEYLYGTAMSSTNASVKEQSPVWAKKVEGRQGEYNEFYTWLSDVFYLCQAAINGRDIYAKDGGVTDVSIRWAELTAKDDVQVMNALAAFIEAMEKAQVMGIVSPQSAFNTLKTFMAIPNDYETEKEAAAKWIKLKINLEALQDRIRSGDIDAGDAIEALFNYEL